MIDVAAVVHFPDVLRTFRSDHPDVDFMLSVAPSGSLLADLRDGRLDLAVCVEPPRPVAGVETVALLSEPMVVYGPPDITIGAPSTWGPWVLFPAESHTRQAVVNNLRHLGAPIEVSAESHQPDVLREMVLLGMGWTVLPRSQGELEPVRLTIGRQILERRLVLARRSGSVHDPAADELATRLRASPKN